MNVGERRNKREMGETAVDGLFAGLIAGMGMAVYLLVVGLLTGAGGIAMLSLFDPQQAGNVLTGLLTHLAVAAIYGLIFGLLWQGLGQLLPMLFKASWLSGVVYGLLLVGLARGVLLTAVNSPLLQVTAVHFAIAHLVYGAVLGYWLGR